jgi:glutaredoxin
MLDDEIEEYKVFLYVHSMGDECNNAKRLLKDHGVKYALFFVDLLHLTVRTDAQYGSDVEKELYLMTGSKELPYIFIDGKYIGDYDKLKEEAKNGVLADRLTAMEAEHTFDPDGYDDAYIDAFDDKYGRVHKKFGNCYSACNCWSKPEKKKKSGVRSILERHIEDTEILLLGNTDCKRSA